MEYNAVLLVIYFVGSIFNVQLGAPVVQELPYQSIEDCQAHEKVLEQREYTIDLEWKVYVRARCLTKEEYLAAKQDAAQALENTTK